LRILLTGRNGQVGSELERALPALGEVIASDRGTLDLADPGAIRRVVREVKPGLIVNAAAYNAVDKAESETALAMQVNAEAPGMLAEEARRLGALMVHYSTDYVFDGEKRMPYAEEDAPNPISYYGRTKLEGERTVAASGCRHLILRTSWVFGPRAANFYQIIQRKARAGESMRMVDDQTSVPTRYEFARAVVGAVGSTSHVDAARTTEFPTAARRPTYSVLDNRKLAALLARALPDWRELLPSLVERL
jgi:dTDP-4-dehydrorhamnose reductase